MLVEFDTFPYQPIHHRCLPEATVPADIAPAQIIRHDKQDVGFRSSLRRFGGVR
jgi:hypothetical protein